MIAKKARPPKPGSVPYRLLIAMKELPEPAAYKEIVDVANRDLSDKHINDSAASQGMLALFRRSFVKRKADKKRGYLYQLADRADPTPVLVINNNTRAKPVNDSEETFLKISRKFFRAQPTGLLLESGLSEEEITTVFTYLMTAD